MLEMIGLVRQLLPDSADWQRFADHPYERHSARTGYPMALGADWIPTAVAVATYIF